MPIPVLPGVDTVGTIASPTVAELTPDLEMRVTWRPEQFDRCQNGGFETDTTGWVVTAGINAAGSSVTRITTDAYEGSACGRIVTGDTDDAGANYDLGTDRYFADSWYSTLYACRLALKRNAGTRHVKVTLGSLGTSSDRATLTIPDISDEWMEYLVTWRPATDRQDVELAIMTADGQAMDVLVDKVCIWSPLASQVENGHFETSVTGWDIAGTYIAAAATSLTRIPLDGFGGDACAELVTTSTDGSGTSYPLGSRTHISGRTYRARVGLKSVSGSSARIRFGSDGTPADRGDETVTITTAWDWFTCDWTPTGDRTDAVVAITNSSAAAITVRIDEVETYEALDEVPVRQLDTVRGAMSEGVDSPIGTISGLIPDTDGTYDPLNDASDLYGAVSTDVPVWARATYNGTLYGVAWGRVQSFLPDPYTETLSFTGLDGLADLAGADIERPFSVSLSYAEAREEAVTDAGLGARQLDIANAAIESGRFFDGLDAPTKALTYLDALNQATGTIHVADPSPHSNVGWVYRSLDRATQTHTLIDFTMDDDSRGKLPGLDLREDTLVTASRVAWQSYDPLPPPGTNGQADYPWGAESCDDGFGIVAIGADPSVYPEQVPWMRYTRPEFGTNERHEYTRERVFSVGLGGESGWITRWHDPIFPLTIAAGTTYEMVLEFLVPMADLTIDADSTDISVEWDAEPARVTIRLQAGASDGTVDGLAVAAYPLIPRQPGEALARSAASVAPREADPVPGTYVPGPAQAEGLARYHVWRHETPRLRPVVTDGLKPVRQLHTSVGDRADFTATKYRISGMDSLVRGISHDIVLPWPWRTVYAFEQLPECDEWVRIDGGADVGIDSSAVLAR